MPLREQVPYVRARLQPTAWQRQQDRLRYVHQTNWARNTVLLDLHTDVERRREGMRKLKLPGARRHYSVVRTD